MRSLLLGLLNLGVVMASTITSPALAESTLTFRNPLMDGITFKSASVNGTTTIWAAGYTAPPGHFYETADGTVTDIGTNLIWRETRFWNSSTATFIGETDITTQSCDVNVTKYQRCVAWGSNIYGNLTEVRTTETYTGGALSPGTLPPMTVSNGTLVYVQTTT